jgi:hypothetical protein
MLNTEIIAVYCDNHTEHIKLLCCVLELLLGLKYTGWYTNALCVLFGLESQEPHFSQMQKI